MDEAERNQPIRATNHDLAIRKNLLKSGVIAGIKRLFNIEAGNYIHFVVLSSFNFTQLNLRYKKNSILNKETSCVYYQ